jgi:uncharacterized protein (DUF1800 family)
LTFPSAFVHTSASPEVVMRQALSRIPRRGTLALAGFALFFSLSSRAADAAVFDLNGDGKSDIVVRNPSTGVNRVLFMNGVVVTSEAPLPPLADRDYVMAALPDLNADGRSDILWYHQSSGERLAWNMNGTTVTSTTAMGLNADTDWRIAGTGALGGDTRADVMFRHEALGQNILWLMTPTGPNPVALPAETDLGWRVAGVADANGDGRADVYWRHRDGRNRVWLMADGVFSQSINLPSRDTTWQIAGLGDYDGNGTADILWRHPVRGTAIIWLMSGAIVVSKSDELFVTHTGDWQPELTADYNGDNKADILWRNRTNSQMQVWLMDGKVKTASGAIGSPGSGFLLAGKAQPPSSETIFLASLTPEGAANTPASGSSTIVLAADGLSARITLNFNNLSTLQTAAHVHGPADAGTSAPALYSVPMGSFNDAPWVFEATAGLSVNDQVDALKTGRLYINVHSTTYPNGEIRGQYRVTSSVGNPDVALPNPPGNGPPTAAEAHRFLQQATMGATTALVSQVQSTGYDAFIESQFAQPASTYTAFVDAAPTANDGDRTGALRTRFFMNALQGPDQLRQRVAFALSQMLVTSTQDIQNGPGMARYQDILVNNAFGNFYNILGGVTFNPFMGRYLDMANSNKPTGGNTANENYTRELMQLFSIGVYKTWTNGSLKIDNLGSPIPTYDQDVIEEMARVFTGFTYAGPGTCTFNCQEYYLAPMKLSQANHDVGIKTILDGQVLPAGQNGFDDVGQTVTAIFLHPNVGPFVARHLIQHLVTSNPSKGYVARVAKVFDNDGTGGRGNLRAVVKAVLMDVEARRDPATDPRFGRLVEPALFITQFVRGMSATGQGYGLAERCSEMQQQIFQSPTVFNFYPADYQVPGTTLLGPPFGIYTETAAVRRANIANTFVYSTISRPGYAPTGTTSVIFDYAPYIASAGNPAALVDALGTRLIPGRMSGTMRQTIINAVTNTANTDTTNRARTAIYLFATSPSFNINR